MTTATDQWEPLYRAEKLRADAAEAEIEAGLAAVEQATAAVERAAREVDRAKRALTASNARADAAEAAVARVRALHAPFTDTMGTWCSECLDADATGYYARVAYPCATIRALDSA